MLNYDGRRFLYKALKSVFESNYPNFEVIFVDNSSKDGSVEFVKQHFAHANNLKIVQNDKNYGYAQGNNIGLQYVSKDSKYIIFLNSDVVVDPNWLKELVKIMETEKTCGAAQCKVLLMNDPNKIDSAGNFMDPLGFTYQRGEDECDKGNYNNVDEIFYPYGAAFILRKSILPLISVEGNLFDPAYFCYHEDADLGWRIRLMGYKVLYCPSSVVYHAKGGAGVRYDIKAERGELSIVFHLTKNRIMSLIKNYSLLNLIRFLPLLLFLDISRAVIVLPHMPRHSLMTFKAIFYIVKNLRQILRKRKVVQQHIRKVDDSDVMRFMVKINLAYNLSKFRKYEVHASSSKS